MTSPSPITEAAAPRTGTPATVTDDEEGWQEAVPRARSSFANKRRPAHGSYPGQDPSQKGQSNYHRPRGLGNTTGGDYNRGGRGNTGPKGNMNHSNENQQPHPGNPGKFTRSDGSGALRRTPNSTPAQAASSIKTSALVQVTAPVVLDSTLEKKTSNETENHDTVVSQLPSPVVRQPSTKFSKAGVPGKGSFSYKEVALTSPGSMLQFRSAVEASPVPDVAAAAVPSDEVKAVEAEATPVEAPSVESPPQEDVDNEKKTLEATTSSASSTPSSADTEVEPEERIIETVESSPPTQSLDSPPQGAGELSNGSEPTEHESPECRIVEVIEDHKPTAEEVSDGAASGISDVPAPGSDDDSPAAVAKRLSAAAPPFNPNGTLTSKAPVSGAVAVTPFKDGRSPPVAGVRPHMGYPPVTVAVTPLCKATHPALAPIPAPGMAMFYPPIMDPYNGVMHGMMHPPFPFLPQMDESRAPLRKVPMATKKMNPDAEEFIPSYLRESAKVVPAESPVPAPAKVLERGDSGDDSSEEAPAGDSPPTEVNVEVDSSHERARLLDVDEKLLVNSLPSHIESERGSPDVEVKCVTVQ